MVGPIVSFGLQPLPLREDQEPTLTEQLREAERADVTSPSLEGREDPGTATGGAVIDPVSVQGVTVQGISIAQQVEEVDVASRQIDRENVEERRDVNAATREEAFDTRGDDAVEAGRDRALEDAALADQRLETRRELEDAVADSLQETQAQAAIAAIAQGAVAQQFAGAQAIAAAGEEPRRDEGEGPGRVTPVQPVDGVDIRA